jgi:hypothetical protein
MQDAGDGEGGVQVVVSGWQEGFGLGGGGGEAGFVWCWGPGLLITVWELRDGREVNDLLRRVRGLSVCRRRCRANQREWTF